MKGLLILKASFIPIRVEIKPSAKGYQALQAAPGREAEMPHAFAHLDQPGAVRPSTPGCHTPQWMRRKQDKFFLKHSLLYYFRCV